MKNIMSNSLIGKTGLWFATKWKESFVCNFLVKDTKDSKIKNSIIYKIFCLPFLLLGFIESKISDWLNHFIYDSFFVSLFLKWGRKAGEVFKNSLLCKFIELVFGFEFKFEGLKLYQIITFALVFLAPIIPTMLCAGFALIAFALWFVSAICEKKFSKGKPDAISFMMLLMIVIFAWFSVTSLAAGKSIQIWALYAVFMLFFFTVSGTCDSKERIYKLAAFFVFSAFLVSVYGIAQKFFINELSNAWIDDEMFGKDIRVYSTLENPNVLGEFLLLSIPVCAAMIWLSKKVFSKVCYTGMLGCMFVCMLLTQSRGCWLGLLLTAAVFAVFMDWRLVLMGVAFLFVLPFIMPQSIINRFMSIGNLNDSSTSYRLYIWLGTLRMLKDYGLYGLGLGSEAYNQIYPFYSYSAIAAPHAHNLYLQLLCDTGVVGTVAFVVIMLISFKKMLITRVSEKKGVSAYIAVAVASGMLGFLFQGVFDYVWYNYRVFLIFWYILAIGISTWRVAENDKADSRNN